MVFDRFNKKLFLTLLAIVSINMGYSYLNGYKKGHEKGRKEAIEEVIKAYEFEQGLIGNFLLDTRNNFEKTRYFLEKENLYLSELELADYIPYVSFINPFINSFKIKSFYKKLEKENDNREEIIFYITKEDELYGFGDVYLDNYSSFPKDIKYIEGKLFYRIDKLEKCNSSGNNKNKICAIMEDKCYCVKPHYFKSYYLGKIIKKEINEEEFFKALNTFRKIKGNKRR